jgi:hypothetical protein
VVWLFIAIALTNGINHSSFFLVGQRSRALCGFLFIGLRGDLLFPALLLWQGQVKKNFQLYGSTYELKI